jgi:WD40 repeat protein
MFGFIDDQTSTSPVRPTHTRTICHRDVTGAAYFDSHDSFGHRSRFVLRHHRLPSHHQHRRCDPPLPPARLCCAAARDLASDTRHVFGVAFSPMQNLLAITTDIEINIFETVKGRLLRTLEAHTGIVDCADFSSNGQLLGSKSNDNTFRLWRCDTWTPIATVSELKNNSHHVNGLAFHPHPPLLATVGSDLGTPEEDRDRVIHI